MSRFGAWTWKEAREQRWAFVGAGIAIAMMTALPFVVVPEEITLQQLDWFPGLAVVLATLVLGLDLFARETRYGTRARILRTPGALRAAFPAKLLVFLASVALLLGLEEIVRHGLSAWTGVPHPTEPRLGADRGLKPFPRDMTPEYLFGIRVAIFGVLFALAVGLWHVVGSVISVRSGIGVFSGILGLAIVASPLAVLYGRHPWWFCLPAHEAYGWLAGLSLAAVGVAAFAWSSGWRFLVPRRRTARRAGLAALVLAGLATGGVALAIERWETPVETAEEIRIPPETTMLGTGGRHLYVTAWRGPVGGGTTPSLTRGPVAQPRWSPPIAWTLDLEHGGAVEDGRFGAEFVRVPGTTHPAFAPVPYLVRLELGGANGRIAASKLIDAESNRPVVGVEWDANVDSDARTIAAARSVEKATTPVRDSKGRRVWILRRYVERDGDEDRVPAGVPRSDDEEGRIPDDAEVGALGWTGVRAAPGSASTAHELWRLDVETGHVRVLTTHVELDDPDRVTEGRWARWWVLDDAHSLRRWSVDRTAGGVEAESGWKIVDHATGAYRSIEGPPLARVFDLVDAGTLLIRAQVEAESDAGNGTRLLLWSPILDVRRVVTSTAPTLLTARHAWCRLLPDGRWLLELLHEQRGIAFATLDARTAALTPLTDWSAVSLHAIAVDVDGSLLAIEDGRRVVRFSDGGARRTVVWPK